MHNQEELLSSFVFFSLFVCLLFFAWKTEGTTALVKYWSR